MAILLRHDRSRSWIVAEAIRQFAARGGELSKDDAANRLGESRLEQLRRDLALSPESRVLEAEETSGLGSASAKPRGPRHFSSYDEFLEWRRLRETR